MAYSQPPSVPSAVAIRASPYGCVPKTLCSAVQNPRALGQSLCRPALSFGAYSSLLAQHFDETMRAKTERFEIMLVRCRVARTRPSSSVATSLCSLSRFCRVLRRSGGGIGRVAIFFLTALMVVFAVNDEKRSCRSFGDDRTSCH